MTDTTPANASVFPEFFVDQLDEVLVAETVTGRFLANDVRYITGRTVQFPKLEFPSGLQDYSRFTSDDDDYTYSLETVQLSNDKEKQFYIDWVDANDFPTIEAGGLIAEFLRVKAVPEMEANFFAKVAGRVPDNNKISTAPTAGNVKGQIDTAIQTLKQVGVKSGAIFMNSATQALFDSALNRTYTNESGINTQVFTYNGWDIVSVPDTVFGNIRFLAVGDGIAKDVRKRSQTFAFAPGQHTNGDGWLIQYHVIYDAIVLDNKTAGLYLNAPAA